MAILKDTKLDTKKRRDGSHSAIYIGRAVRGAQMTLVQVGVYSAEEDAKVRCILIVSLQSSSEADSAS